MSDDTTEALNRIADALELQALVAARDSGNAETIMENDTVLIGDEGTKSRWMYYTHRIDQLSGYKEDK
ncbi:hypothetical protein ACFP47_09330 [Nesterenkonia lacusekhoensis]|uniref:Uncharacterized protein n=1 Tax=Nesterenkonia lacusekhoensis TaxID=150832 RepID=A0ABS4SZ24_9MICC|nr:hypothetical protein [Nesterenkonia lacusekhoensis]MBP2317383.1 hypothetical protein [Nesterenkonia lacusekhoensis]